VSGDYGDVISKKQTLLASCIPASLGLIMYRVNEMRHDATSAHVELWNSAALHVPFLYLPLS
jgi:hypothetical protein